MTRSNTSKLLITALGIFFISIIYLQMSTSTTSRAAPATGAEFVPASLVKMRIAERVKERFRQPVSAASTFRAGIQPLFRPAEHKFTERAKVVALPDEFLGFVETVRDGEDGMVRGVYVEGVLALPVIQQPEKEPTYVSTKWDVVTQFSSAARNGVTGLLAHNYLSGADFYQLTTGQEIWVVYGDGSYRRYKIEDISQYQKLTPSSLQSELIELSTGKRLTTSQVFNRHYNGDHKLTLQTCLENEGLSNWGLTFWTATPLDPDS